MRYGFSFTLDIASLLSGDKMSGKADKTSKGTSAK